MAYFPAQGILPILQVDVPNFLLPNTFKSPFFDRGTIGLLIVGYKKLLLLSSHGTPWRWIRERVSCGNTRSIKPPSTCICSWEGEIWDLNPDMENWTCQFDANLFLYKRFKAPIILLSHPRPGMLAQPQGLLALDPNLPGIPLVRLVCLGMSRTLRS